MNAWVTILFTSYALVFCAELIGDKTFYTIGTLATRNRLWPIFCGSTIAFMLKMLAAVLLGRVIAHLPPIVVASLSAATFFILALAIWFKKPEDDKTSSIQAGAWFKVALAAFASIFFSEWGDVGQIAAATLSARYGEPSIVWVGAVLAMITKGALAITIGATLRTRVPQHILRYSTFGICVVMGVLAVFRVDL